MSSMDLDAPPLRSILMAIFIVVGLHVLTAVALVAIKPAAPKVALVKEKPPIEIEMISLAATLPVESEAVEVELQEAAPKSQPTSKPKSKPEPKSKEPSVQEKKPDTIARVKQKKTAAVNKEKPQQENKLQEKKQHPNIDKAIADAQRANEQRANEQRNIVAAQAEKAAQEAHAQAVQDAKRLADAKNARDAQAQADAKAAKEAAELSASKEAEAAARAKAKADTAAKAAAAANDTPVNFTASNANWASAPNFSFPDRAARRAHSGDTFNVVLVLRVNKQGGIDSVRIAQSSGNAILDKEAQRQVRSGKFKPFMKNGAAVVGNVTLPIAYTVP